MSGSAIGRLWPSELNCQRAVDAFSMVFQASPVDARQLGALLLCSRLCLPLPPHPMYAKGVPVGAITLCCRLYGFPLLPRCTSALPFALLRCFALRFALPLMHPPATSAATRHLPRAPLHSSFLVILLYYCFAFELVLPSHCGVALACPTLCSLPLPCMPT